MEKDSKIFVSGHRGMVGSAIVRALEAAGYTNILTQTHNQLDLTRQEDTEKYFEEQRPDYVFLAAAKVGGILANNSYKAEFIYQNLMIASNTVEASYKVGVKKLMNLGSACIYPKLAPQPLKEEYLLTGLLEPTNDAYAIAKIAAIRLCKHYNEQFGTNYISVMPINLYGENDNYHLKNSHVLPAMIRKFHLAKLLKENKIDDICKDFKRYGSPEEDLTKADESKIRESLKKIGVSDQAVVMWGSGSPYREFLYADDLADACLYLMNQCDASDIGEFVNIGIGVDNTIKEIAEIVRDTIGFDGEISWDTSKPDGTPRKLLDVDRLSQLGWKAKIDLRKGLELAYVDYQKKMA